MLKLFLWLKYLRRKKIALLSIAAVALCCALLIVIASLFDGFIEAIKDHYADTTGDVILWSPQPIPQYELFLDKLTELDKVIAAAPCSFSTGLLHLAGGDVREVIINGIDPARDGAFSDWTESLLRQKDSDKKIDFEVPDHPDDIGVWLGIAIAAEPNEKTDEYDLAQAKKLIGRSAVLTTVKFIKDNDADTDNKIRRKAVKLRISDIALTRTYFGDKALYIDFRQLQKLQFTADEAENIRAVKIKLTDRDDAQAPAMIRKEWQLFAGEQLGWDKQTIAQTRITTYEQLGNEYYAELRSQMGVVMLIFGVVCSATILLIFCIFYMIVTTRRKDIAIIKSCGTGDSSVASVFLGYGMCIGIAGAAIGIGLGHIVMKNINTLENWIRIIFGLKIWRSSIYILDKIPSQVAWDFVAPIVIAAIAASVIGALIPAVIAARTRPVEILRYE